MVEGRFPGDPIPGGAAAHLVGATTPTGTAIENGKKPPSSKVLFAIAAALGLHSHELLASVEGRFQRGRAFGPPGLGLEAPSRRQAWFHAAREPLLERADAAAPAPVAASPTTALWRRPVPYSSAGFLLEIDRLSRGLSDDDRDLVLRLARRLAGQE